MLDGSAPTGTEDPSSIPPGTRIAERYIVQRLVGRGAMGAVYEVRDERTSRRLALKQLGDTDGLRATQRRLVFQREYHTLSQLTHPSIIETYDYGVDERGPYYTMELLDGEDARTLAPLPWREACRVLRDVASSLAILHSRRLLHRDVSARNVRRTSDGRAKLMDFGALLPIGSSGAVVGTPPFVPPEVANGRPLQPGADLFALGALAYWLLTGRHAYPAKHLHELRDAWRSRPVPVARRVPDAPEALETLVMSLLSLDPAARPATAAEVIGRLNAIAELPADEALDVAHAYLCTPKLVGRGEHVTRIRQGVWQTSAGRGAVFTIAGEAGTGRTRLLRELIVEAKLAGTSVVHVAASVVESGAYRVALRLLREAHLLAPETTSRVSLAHRKVLVRAFGELRDVMACDEGELPADPAERRAMVQAALRGWLRDFAALRKTTLAIDDLHRCDEPSAALLAGLARDAQELPLVLAATSRSDAPAVAPRATEAFAKHARALALQSLQEDDTHELLASVFGDVPNLPRVSGCIYDNAGGNPMRTMLLARVLVDNQVARYENGAWRLPDDLSAQTLPADLAKAYAERIRRLSPHARFVAELLCVNGGPVSLRFCRQMLADITDDGLVFGAIDELVMQEVIVGSDRGYAFAQEALRDAVDRSIGASRRAELHLRVGRALEAACSGRAIDLLTTGYHLIRGGDEARGAELVVGAAAMPEIYADSSDVAVRAVEDALRICERDRRSLREQLSLRFVLITLGYYSHPHLFQYAARTMELLQRDAGLTDLHELDSTLPPEERLRQAMTRARERHEKADERERGLSPTAAVAALCRCAMALSGAAAVRFEIDTMQWLADMIAPLSCLDRRTQLYYEMILCNRDAMLGRIDKAMRERQRFIELLDDEELFPRKLGAARKVMRAIHLYQLGMTEGLFDLDRALERADQLQSLGLKAFDAAVCQIRMQGYLYDGRAAKTEECRQRVETLSIQGGTRWQIDLSTSVFLAGAYALSGDLLGLKHSVDRFEQLSDVFPQYEPYLLSVRGSYHRERGDLDAACRQLQQALELVGAGEHAAWPHAAAAYAETLLAQARYETAADYAAAAIADAQRAEIGHVHTLPLVPALAVAEAHLGRTERAAARLDEAIAGCEARPVARLVQGVLFEARARVAILQHDGAAYERAVRWLADSYGSSQNPALINKYRRVLDEALASRMPLTPMARQLAEQTALSSMGPDSYVRAILADCHTRGQRAQAALCALAQHCSSTKGHLYTRDGERLTRLASLGDEEPPEDMHEALQRCVASELGTASDGWDTDEEEHTETFDTTLVRCLDGRVYQPVILRVTRDGRAEVAAVAAIAVSEDRVRTPSISLVDALAAALCLEDHLATP